MFQEPEYKPGKTDCKMCRRQPVEDPALGLCETCWHETQRRIITENPPHPKTTKHIIKETRK